MPILARKAVLGLTCILLPIKAFSECEEQTRKHCAGLYNKSGADEFHGEQSIRGRPRIEEDRQNSRSKVFIDDVDGDTVRVRWRVRRFSCVRYKISICW